MPRQVQAKAEKKKASFMLKKDAKKDGTPNGDVLDVAAAYLPLVPALAFLNPLAASEAVEPKEGKDQVCASCRSRSLNSFGMGASRSSDKFSRKSGSADSFPIASSEGRLSDPPREEVEEVGEGGMPILGDGCKGGRDGGEEDAWANSGGLKPIGSELTRRKKTEDGMRMDGLDRTVFAS